MRSSAATGGIATRRLRRRLGGVLLVAAALAPVTACAHSGMHHMGKGSSDMPGMPDMPDMSSVPTGPAVAEASPAGTGLSSSAGGYALQPVQVSATGTCTLRINGPGGRAATRYQPYESRLVIPYIIRSDLSGYQLLDPAMRQDGTWQAQCPALRPGSYRAFVTFAAPDAREGTPLRYTLSRTFTVPGADSDAPLPSATTSSTVDGFRVTWSGMPRAGTSSALAISITENGKPVGHVDRFLDGYVHLVAFRAGDLAFAHILPTGRDGSGNLTATAMFPESGTWRLFAQFQTNGVLHTTAFTIVVPRS
jgi:hypothetical protein